MSIEKHDYFLICCLAQKFVELGSQNGQTWSTKIHCDTTTESLFIYILQIGISLPIEQNLQH